MAEIKAKKKLEEISMRMGNKVSADQLLNIFKNQNKYSNEKLIDFLKNYIKIHILDGDKLIAQFENNIKKNGKSPFESFLVLINCATIVSLPNKPPIAAKPILESRMSVKSTSDVFESPVLSSTRLENNNIQPEIVVSEVKKNILSQ